MTDGEQRVLDTAIAQVAQATVEAVIAESRRLDRVTCDTMAVFAHYADVVLRVMVALGGGEPIPFQRLGIALAHAESVFVHDSQGVLRTGFPLVRQQAK